MGWLTPMGCMCIGVIVIVIVIVIVGVIVCCNRNRNRNRTCNCKLYAGGGTHPSVVLLHRRRMGAFVRLCVLVVVMMFFELKCII